MPPAPGYPICGLRFQNNEVGYSPKKGYGKGAYRSGIGGVPKSFRNLPLTLTLPLCQGHPVMALEGPVGALKPDARIPKLMGSWNVWSIESLDKLALSISSFQNACKNYP